MRYAGNPTYLLGFHGCDREIGEDVLSGNCNLSASTNNYDWLGQGIYFWENNLARAEEWAEQRLQMPNSSIRHPFVVGAIIDPGFCLSLMQKDHLEMITVAHQNLKSATDAPNAEMPENSGGKDKFLRRLDCAVIQYLHKSRAKTNRRPFDSVRGVFEEGGELYPGSGFRTGNHIQLYVRNRECIKGYFRPMKSL